MDDLFSLLREIVAFILHVDQYLDAILASFGNWFYLVLFVIVFCETGLVVTPFLPGDSLLFAAGALIARSSLNVHILAVSLFFAAVLGDFVNYHVGKYLGPRALALNSRWLNHKHLERTERFFQKYGPFAIVLARFAPIVRTFAPFMAGVGAMSYSRFFFYNVLGAFLWVTLFTYAGYFFGEIPQIRDNFTLTALAIIAVSLLPLAYQTTRSCIAAVASKPR
jgi:membrane-associated protein